MSRPQKTPRTLLVDADSFIYQAASSNQHPIEWTKDLWTLHGDLGKAKAQLDDTIRALMDNLDADHVVMALSDYTDPWRKQILPTYKSNRKSVMKPILLAPLREYVTEQYETFQRPGLEGDDVLGILMTAPKAPIGGDPKAVRVCVSIDKDMKTIPGFHFDPGRDTVERHVTEAQADYWHLSQTLSGDTTDGYSGCPGVGPKKANTILADAWDGLTPASSPEAWALVVKAYEKAGLDEAAAIQQAQVARICRAGDYDFKTRKVKPWQPPR